MNWFIHDDANILGPLDTEQVKSKLRSGEVSYSSHIWSEGQVEWQPLSTWEDHVNANELKLDYERLKWKLRESQDKTMENLSYQEVIMALKKYPDLKRVAVSFQDEDQWTPVYSSYIFMEALGLSRRNFLRAPLMGLAKVSRSQTRFSYVVKTSTIGPGGIGLYGLASNFTPGTPIQLRIESEDLQGSIHVSGVIKYHTDQGFVGIAFDELKPESKELITNYIGRFQSESFTKLSQAS